MRCVQVLENLNAFLDQELPLPIRNELMVHLSSCVNCRQAIERRERLGNLLRGLPIPGMPSDLARRTLERARQPQIGAALTLLPLGGRLGLRFRLAAAAAVLLLGSSLGSWMGWQMGQPSGPPPSPPDAVAVDNLDYLGSTPDGSLPQAYLTLVASRVGAGE